MSIPYMGSKRKLATKIVNQILELNPECKYFYDLFGGGGAISIEALRHKKLKKVVYNEINTGVVELLRYIQKNGVTKDFYNWIDRDTFEKHKNDNTWFGGLVKTCWSFGNNQNGYLYGKHIEEHKRLMHNIIVNDDNESKKEFNKIYNTTIDIIEGETVNERRLYVQKYLTKTVKDWSIFDGFCNNDHSIRSILEILQSLERLERLERLESLHISNLSYEDVKIDTPINETVIYCDIPYQDTADYQYSIDYEKFYNWCNNNKYKVYVSSYKTPLFEVTDWEHRSILSANVNNKVIEKLFCNKKEKTSLFD